jgi:hypothetical protein
MVNSRGEGERMNGHNEAKRTPFGIFLNILAQHGEAE